MRGKWSRNSRTVIKDGHLERGCPICWTQVELDHTEACEAQATLLALEFAELGLVTAITCEPSRTLPLGWHVTDFDLVC